MNTKLPIGVCVLALCVASAFAQPEGPPRPKDDAKAATDGPRHDGPGGIADDELREMIMNNVQIDELRKAARDFGMVTLRDAGISYMHEGVTTIEEVIRETIIDA